MKRLLAAIFLLGLLAPAPGTAQAIQQSGAVTPFHAPAWFYNGILGDGGTPSAPYLNSLGLFNGANCPFGISSQTSPGTPTSQWAALTICQTTSTTTFNINGYGGLPTPSVYFNIGGTLYPFPSGSALTATPLRTVTSGISDTVLSADSNGTVAWNSSTALAKAETLFACVSALNGFIVTVKDEAGTAGTYPITVAVSGGGLIDGASSYIMAINHQATGFQCDGTTGNWIVR